MEYIFTFLVMIGTQSFEPMADTPYQCEMLRAEFLKMQDAHVGECTEVEVDVD